MLSAKTIILIGGYAGSGKDAVANFLCEGFGFCRLAYADALKDHVSSKYDIPLKLMYTQEGKNSMIEVKNTYMSVRNLLVKEATDKRLVDKNVWVDVVKNYISKHNIQKVVIPDFRFENEYTVLANHFPSQIQTIKIIRPGIKVSQDVSEHQLDNFAFDTEIVNDGTLEQLYNKVCGNTGGTTNLFFSS
jgi:hypothetical protein